MISLTEERCEELSELVAIQGNTRIANLEAARLTRLARIAGALGADSPGREFENVGRCRDRCISQVARGRPPPQCANGDETSGDEAGQKPPETIHEL